MQFIFLVNPRQELSTTERMGTVLREEKWLTSYIPTMPETHSKATIDRPWQPIWAIANETLPVATCAIFSSKKLLFPRFSPDANP
jgi:hypothetical protein